MLYSTDVDMVWWMKEQISQELNYIYQNNLGLFRMKLAIFLQHD